MTRPPPSAALVRLAAPLLAAALAAGPGAAAAQVAPGGAPPRLELTALAGWQLNSDVSTVDGTLSVANAPSYTALLGYLVHPGGHAELSYAFSPTHARFTSPGGLTTRASAGLDVHAFQLGGTQGYRRGRVEPFVVGSLGATLFVPGTIELSGGQRLSGSDVWAFSVTAGGGVKVWLGERIALRLQGRVLLPVFFQGASFWAGSGGSGLAVSGTIPMVTGDFSGGLAVAF